jgi:hypothetical protein
VRLRVARKVLRQETRRRRRALTTRRALCRAPGEWKAIVDGWVAHWLQAAGGRLP